MKKSLSVFMIVALAVVFSFGSAYAGFTTKATKVTVMEEADSTVLENAAVDAAIVYTTVAGESLTINDTITYTLTGGATFSDVTPTLTPADDTFDLGAGTNTATAPLSGGQEGDTTATWRVVETATAGTITLTLNSDAAGGIFDVSALDSTGNVNLTIDMMTVVPAPIGTTRYYRATSTDDYLFDTGDAYTTVNTAASDVADVAATDGIYTLFTGNTEFGSTSVLSVTNDTGANTLPMSTDFASESVLITLEGDFTGIESISAVGCTTCTGSDANGDTTDGTVAEFLINDDKTMAYVVNNVALAGGEMLAVNPQFELDGETSQTARTFTAKIEILNQADWDPTVMLSATTHQTITRNGAQFYVPRMISAGTYTSYLFLKSVSSAVAADVIFDLVNVAGETASVTLTLPAAADGGYLQVSAADLLDATVGWTDTSGNFGCAVTVALPLDSVTIDGSLYNATTTDNNVMTIYQDAGRNMEY